jgi:hypothetical protein
MKCPACNSPEINNKAGSLELLDYDSSIFNFKAHFRENVHVVASLEHHPQ